MSKKRFLTVFHYIALTAMLNSSFVAPAQGIITAFIEKHNFSGLWNRKISSDDSDYITKADNTENTVSTPKPQPLNKVRDQRITLKEFKSPDREAFIGTSKEQPFDNPADNIFRIQINRIPDSNTKALLTYDIYGIDANTAVARSINDRMSVGGYMIKTNSQWDTHTEAINPTWLRQGENTVLFTIPQGACYNYKVKNVKILFQAIDRLEKNENIVIQNTVKTTEEDRLYIKGFVKNGATGTKIIVGNSVLETEDGEFEAIINFTEDMKASGKVSVKTIDPKGIAVRKLVDLNATPNVENVIAIKNKIHGTSKYFKRYAPGDLTYDGVTIAIKDSAVVKNTTISVRRLRGVDIAPLGQGMINVTKGGSAYRFLPDGTKFKKNVELSIPYDTLRIPSGYTSKDIRTFYFDVHSRKWTVTKKLSEDKKSRTITSLTNHFTDYINGIIQSPESPETAAFAPTVMSDLKVADPSAEIGLIAPPSPSQKGDGTISYPLHIPSGRKGMQPSLALKYSNGNNSNIGFGLGWNLEMSSITIDTRWGIPSFDSSKETELYSLNGEMLMYPEGYLPHRHQLDSINSYIFNPQYRTSNLNSNGNKLFTPRNKSSFTRIERIGNSPTSYYWKVTGTDGTIYWYGGYENFEPNTVVRDASNNIVHWGLYKVVDVFGNTMKYVYNSRIITSDSPDLSNYPGLIGSKSFYLDSIVYTGRVGDEEYPYRISFIRSSTIRPDFTINTKFGFKWINPYSINSIMVNYDNEVIRTYRLTFTEGKFGKQLLSSVAAEDIDSQKFYEHKFAYYDDIPNDIYFGDTKTISIPSFNANFSLGLGNGNLMNASKIYSSQNSETGFSIKPTVGIQIAPRINQKYNGTVLLGAPFGQSTVKSRGKISLMDIDGDGIDDIVFRHEDGLRYLPGQLGTNGLSFSSTIKSIQGISEFTYSKTKTNTIFGDSWDLQFKRFFAGTQRTKSKSETQVYLIDANADGLVDVVNNGVVRFNSIDTATGEPNFTSRSDNTPNMVLRTTTTAAGEPVEPEKELAEDTSTASFDDHYDLVRVWVAPTTGVISIKNKLNNHGPGTAPFTIELFHNNAVRIVYSTTLVDLNFGNELTTYAGSQERIEVNKGDRLYFRFHTNETGSNPILETYHIIRYLQAVLPYGSVDNPELGLYESESDLHSSTEKPIELPGSGTVSITWPTFVQSGTQHGGIRYKIYKRTTDSQGNVSDEVLYPDPTGNPDDGICTYGNDTTVLPSSNLSNIPVTGDNISIIFAVEGNSSILSKGLQRGDSNTPRWYPKLTYRPDAVASGEGIAAMETYAVPNYTTYHKVDYVGKYDLLQSDVDPTNPDWITPISQTTYGIKPNIDIVNNGYLNAGDNGSFIFSYHDGVREYDSRIVNIINGQIILPDSTPITYCTDCVAGDSVNHQSFEFSYFVDSKNTELFERYRRAVDYNTAVMGYGDWNSSNNTTKTKMVSLNCKGDFPQFGQLLNEWGQFLYNDAYDTNTDVRPSEFGKLINDQIVMNPYSGINFSGSPLLNSNCDSNALDYANCLEDYISSVLRLPEEGSDMSGNTDSAIAALQQNANSLNVPFNMPFLPMEIKRQDYNWQNDKSYGFYNSQYISYNMLRVGNREESSAASDSNSGGAGLSYPDLSSEPDPDTYSADLSTGMLAINKIHRSSSRNWTMGYDIPTGSQNSVPVSYGTSKSSYSSSVTDFIDMNGDGYPDCKSSAKSGHLVYCY